MSFRGHNYIRGDQDTTYEEAHPHGEEHRMDLTQVAIGYMDWILLCQMNQSQDYGPINSSKIFKFMLKDGFMNKEVLGQTWKALKGGARIH